MTPALDPKVAVYPGTFDPITNGHVDIVRRALPLFERVIVAVAENAGKGPLFSVEERVVLVKASFANDARVEVVTFSGLLVDQARACGARTLIRGLRAIADFEHEFQLALMNRQLAPDLETIFLMTSEESFYVSSSLVKEVAILGGDISKLAPPAVVKALAGRVRKPPQPSDV